MHIFISILAWFDHFNSNFVKLKILYRALNEINYIYMKNGNASST